MLIMDRIRKIMGEKNLSRADLVKLSGLKKTTVYRLFEEGVDDSKIRIGTLAPIAKALSVNIDYVINGVETLHKSE